MIRRLPRIALTAIASFIGLSLYAPDTSVAESVELLPELRTGIDPPTGELVKPKGKGPFPAIVLQHGCDGVQDGYRWVANKLVGWGYVVLLVDSFTSRGAGEGPGKGVCALPFSEWIGAVHRAQDAYRGLAYLRGLDFVAGDRVGLLGYSNGGVSALEASAASALGTPRNLKFAGGPFAAVLAIYPECGQRYGAWRVVREDETKLVGIEFYGTYRPLQPLLIITGERDDWTPAEFCKKMVEMSGNSDLQLIVYPGAHHAFDTVDKVHFSPKVRNWNSKTGLGAHKGGNAKARKRIYVDMKDFFDRHLKRSAE